MTLTKKTVIDKIEIVKIEDYYRLQIREDNQVLQDSVKLSGSFHRYALNPDYDISKITDSVVKSQFQAIMTDAVKKNYQTHLKKQNEEKKSNVDRAKKS